MPLWKRRRKKGKYDWEMERGGGKGVERR